MFFKFNECLNTKNLLGVIQIIIIKKIVQWIDFSKSNGIYYLFIECTMVDGPCNTKFSNLLKYAF